MEFEIVGDAGVTMVEIERGGKFDALSSGTIDAVQIYTTTEVCIITVLVYGPLEPSLSLVTDIQDDPSIMNIQDVTCGHISVCVW